MPLTSNMSIPLLPSDDDILLDRLPGLTFTATLLHITCPVNILSIVNHNVEYYLLMMLLFIAER